MKKVIKSNDKTIAEIVYSIGNLPYNIPGKDIMHIESVWVDKQHRKEGIAKKLVKEVIENYKIIGIFVECTDGSKKFWKKIGFEFTGNRSLICINKLIF
jgi:predicted GNAT family acetyltransferase